MGSTSSTAISTRRALQGALPDADQAAVDHHDRQRDRALEPAAPIAADPRVDRGRDELVARARPEHERVVLGEQPDHVPCRFDRRREVRGEADRGRALDVDGLEVVPESFEDALRGRRQRADPAPELRGRRRSVGVQEPTRHLVEGVGLVHLLPATDPLVGADERHLRAAARSEAQDAGEGTGRQQVAPRRQQALLGPGADPLGDVVGEFFARQARARRAPRVWPRRVRRPARRPRRSRATCRPPSARIARKAAIHIGSSRAGSRWSVRARSDGLHEGVLVPQGAPHVGDGDLDAGRDRELGRAQDLGLDRRRPRRRRRPVDRPARARRGARRRRVVPGPRPRSAGGGRRAGSSPASPVTPRGAPVARRCSRCVTGRPARGGLLGREQHVEDVERERARRPVRSPGPDRLDHVGQPDPAADRPVERQRDVRPALVVRSRAAGPSRRTCSGRRGPANRRCRGPRCTGALVAGDVERRDQARRSRPTRTRARRRRWSAPRTGKASPCPRALRDPPLAADAAGDRRDAGDRPEQADQRRRRSTARRRAAARRRGRRRRPGSGASAPGRGARRRAFATSGRPDRPVVEDGARRLEPAAEERVRGAADADARRRGLGRGSPRVIARASSRAASRSRRACPRRSPPATRPRAPSAASGSSTTSMRRIGEQRLDRHGREAALAPTTRRGARRRRGPRRPPAR